MNRKSKLSKQTPVAKNLRKKLDIVQTQYTLEEKHCKPNSNTERIFGILIVEKNQNSDFPYKIFHKFKLYMIWR